MAAVRLAVLGLLFSSVIQMARAEEGSGRDFTIADISQPGGLALYLRWEAASRTLTYKTVGFPDMPIDVQKLTAADSRTVDQGVALGLDHIAALIIALPDQKTLPDDHVRAFDGGRYELSCTDDGKAITRHYDNPGEHHRLMDVACVGLVARVEAYAREAFATTR
ncbi:MAG: hypothetical protein H0X38_16085 [Planctomycetes bacterium]|nr:hypothetical protein [Planctomycetota bacterium]